MRSPPPARRGNAVEPHQRGRDPRRGRIRAAAAPSRAGREHLAGPPRPRHPPAPDHPAGLRHLARLGGDRQGRSTAARPRPDRTRPARPGHPGRLPGTRVVPAVSWLLSLLALKLTRTRRVSHVDDLLLADPAAALFAGLSTLPKKSALTDYSY